MPGGLSEAVQCLSCAWRRGVSVGLFNHSTQECGPPSPSALLPVRVWSKNQNVLHLPSENSGPSGPASASPPTLRLAANYRAIPSREGIPQASDFPGSREGPAERYRYPVLLPSWILVPSPSHVPDQWPCNIPFQQDLQIHSAHSWHPPPRLCHHGNLLSASSP